MPNRNTNMHAGLPTPEVLLSAYRSGHFPMAPSRDWHGPLSWFNPLERGIIPLDSFHLPRRLRDRLRSRRFRITTDQAFERVIRGCAAPREGEADTWINADIERLYTDLHHAGHAHSIEAWLGGDGPPTLVGGLYGVHIGGAFFAESKFSVPEQGGTDASKVCLAHLLMHAQRRGFGLVDVQYWNPHLDQFGCLVVHRSKYLRLLGEQVARSVDWQPFDAEANLRAV